MNNNESVFNLKDVLAECLFKWHLILLAAILGCVAGLGISVYKTREYQAALAAQQALQAAQEEAAAAASLAAEEEEAEEPGVHNGPYDEQMAEAKALLTQLEITKVDGLYAQYAANIQLRDSLADNINNSVIMKMDADTAAVTRLMYKVTSDQDYIANNLSSLIVTDDLLEQAAVILGEDVAPKYLQDLFSVWKGSTGTTGDSIHIYNGDKMSSVIYLQAIAYTEDQADRIAELMARKLKSAIDDMHDLDSDMEIERIGDVSSAVTSSTIDDVQRTLVAELNNVANQIVSMELNEIGKLTDNERTYYELLVSEGKGIHIDEDTDSTETDTETVVTTDNVQLTPPSKAKYVALGLIGAALLAVAAVFVYAVILSKKARSLAEIEYGTGIPTLAVFERRRGKVKDPIIRSGIDLQTGDKAVQNEESYQPILAVRVKELLQQSGRQHLYLYNDGVLDLKGVAEIASMGGKPETSADAMQQFLQADSVILVVRMYEMEMTELSNIIALCKVHGKQILGNIVIYA